MKAHYESFKHKLPFSMNLISLGSLLFTIMSDKTDLTSDLSFTIIGDRKVTRLDAEVIMAKDTKERIFDGNAGYVLKERIRQRSSDGRPELGVLEYGLSRAVLILQVYERAFLPDRRGNRHAFCMRISG